MKATVSGVFEDLKIKISEDLEQNWSYPDSALLAVPAKLRQGETPNLHIHNSNLILIINSFSYSLFNDIIDAGI